MIRTTNFFTVVVACGMACGIALGDDDVDLSKLPPAAKGKIDFAKQIKPVLEKSCLKCHGEKRPKSKFRVDSRETIMKGGSSEEAAIVNKKSEKSPLIHFIADLVEEYEMPPLDKRDRYPKLTEEQIALFRAWVDQGVQWPKDVTLELPATN